MLTAATDGKCIDHPNPGLLEGGARQIVGGAVGPSDPAQHLVLLPHHMLEVEEERDLALIEMGEIDSGREYAATCIFRMRDGSAAQDRDLASRIEDRKVDGSFEGCQRRLVERIERSGIAKLDDQCLSEAADVRGPKIDRTARLEGRQQGVRLR